MVQHRDPDHRVNPRAGDDGDLAVIIAIRNALYIEAFVFCLVMAIGLAVLR